METNVPRPVTESWRAADFALVLERAALFASDDDTRPHLSAVLVEPDGNGVRCVATDGHTLAVFTATTARVEPDPLAKWAIMIPGAHVGPLVKFLRARVKACRAVEGLPVAVSIESTRATFTGHDGASTIVPLEVNAPFPPYEQVIPRVDENTPQGVGPIGVATRYLARVGLACKGLDANGLRMFRGAPTKSDKTGALEPLLFAYASSEPAVTATMVVMPMRI